MGTFQAGYEALPAGGTGAGVMVLHPWWGLNAFMKSFCDRLAGEGFVVLAPDLYHGEIATTMDEAENLSSKLDGQAAAQEITAVVDHLKKHPAVKSPSLGVIGFSLGAFFALKLAQQRPEDSAAVVLFYGTGDGHYDRIKSAFLGHFAENDPFEDAEVVQQLEVTLHETGQGVEFHTYPGTGHWFFEQDRADAYNADAAALAWERTVNFLKQRLNQESVT